MDPEVRVAADAEAPGENAGVGEDPVAEGDGDTEGEGAVEEDVPGGEEEPEEEGDGEDEGDGEGEAEEDGDTVGCGDPAAADAEPTTRWPAGICAEPVVTSVRDPTEGGASAGSGAACPLIPPGATVARVAEAGT